jgi:hypothetical protein
LSPGGERVASALWRVDRDLVLALDERLGPPVDSYVNGSQTWLVDDGPGDITLEWRLHPAPSYDTPHGLSHYDVWEQVVASLSSGDDPAALPLGDERRALTSLWDGLEAFVAYDDDVEPANLAQAVTDALGIPPALVGMVDHHRIGEAWERTRGAVSITELLEEQLHP